MAPRISIPKAVRELAQFVGGFPRLAEIAGRNHDLHVRGEEARALEGIGRRRQHAPRRRRRHVHTALRHAQQRQTRMRITALFAGLRVGLLGVGQLSAKAMDLTLLVQRAAGGAAMCRSR
jgi:hypothetical protein